MEAGDGVKGGRRVDVAEAEGESLEGGTAGDSVMDAYV